MSRRKKVRIVSYLTALAVVLGAWGVCSTVKLVKTRRELNAAKERALTSLGTYLDTISLDLNKSVYVSTSPMMATLSNDVWRATAGAKASLSEIIDGQAEPTSVYKFLSQTGEYTMSINKKLAAGKTITNEELDNLRKLKEYAGDLSSKLNYLIDEKQSGNLDFERVKSTLSDGGDSQKLILGNELEDAEQSMDDYPTLIYDGPFSDNIENKKSELIENLSEIEKSDARKKAAEFLGAAEENVYFLSEVDGNLPCYTFYNENYTVSVTKKGGIVSYMLSSKYAGESEISEKKAVKTATEFLKSKGYKNIKNRYYSTNDGICTANFAYFEDGIIYYTDLIKVSISLENGEITAFDSTGYLMNHKKRNVDGNYKYTLKSGARKLNKDLEVLSSQKAFIPTEFGTEEYVYEYRCKAKDGTELLVYIDPYTGNEKDILILLYADGGILTE